MLLCNLEKSSKLKFQKLFLLVFQVCWVVPLAVQTPFYKLLFWDSCFGTLCCNFSLIRLFCSYNRVAGPPLDSILNTKGFYHIIVVRALPAADPGLVLCCGTRDCIPSIPTLISLYIQIKILDNKTQQQDSTRRQDPTTRQDTTMGSDDKIRPTQNPTTKLRYNG